MKRTALGSLPSRSRSLRWALQLLGLSLVGSVAFAQGPGNDPGTGPPPPPIPSDQTSVPGEEVTSLPSVVDEGAGFRLHGTPADLAEALLAVSGQGRIDVVSSAPGRFDLLFRGDWSLRLAPRPLQEGRVGVAFQARTPRTGGFAHLGIGTRGVSLALAELWNGVDLPVAETLGTAGLRASAAPPDWFLLAAHPDLGLVTGAVQWGERTVDLVQRTTGP